MYANLKTLAAAFRLVGRKWKVGGVLQVPTQEDLETVLDKAREELYDHPVPSEWEMGGLLVRRRKPETFEVYMYVGDLPPNPKEN